METGGENREVMRKEASEKQRNEDKKRQLDVEHKENPKEAANVEDAETVLGPTGIEEDAADQKSRWNKEQSEASSAQCEKCIQSGRGNSRRGHVGHR